MKHLVTQTIEIAGTKYNTAHYRLAGKWRGEAAQGGRVVLTIDAHGPLSVRAGLRRALARRAHHRETWRDT